MDEHTCFSELHEISKDFLAQNEHRSLSELNIDKAFVFILKVDVLY